MSRARPGAIPCGRLEASVPRAGVTERSGGFATASSASGATPCPSAFATPDASGATPSTAPGSQATKGSVYSRGRNRQRPRSQTGAQIRAPHNGAMARAHDVEVRSSRRSHRPSLLDHKRVAGNDRIAHDRRDDAGYGVASAPLHYIRARRHGSCVREVVGVDEGYVSASRDDGVRSAHHPRRRRPPCRISHNAAIRIHQNAARWHLEREDDFPSAKLWVARRQRSPAWSRSRNAKR